LLKETTGALIGLQPTTDTVWVWRATYCAFKFQICPKKHMLWKTICYERPYFKRHLTSETITFCLMVEFLFISICLQRPLSIFSHLWILLTNLPILMG